MQGQKWEFEEHGNFVACSFSWISGCSATWKIPIFFVVFGFFLLLPRIQRFQKFCPPIGVPPPFFR
jgi:hypothetical protein